jgi:phage/plasmid-like protein (TIGR03299 family)
LGKVAEKAMGALKALREIGAYEVYLAEAKANGIKLDRNAILRRPTDDDPVTRVFGIVSKDYTLLTPEDVCSIYDERVGQPVETIGALGYGETFFLSTYLPTVDVKGDEVENYLLISNPMTGLASAEIRVTPVRVVCENTLIASDRYATEKLRIVHDATAKVRFGEWLQETYEIAETTVKVLTDLFTLMASTRARTADAQKLFEAAYPIPNKPRTNAPKAVVEQRIRWWEENVNLMERRREGAKILFEGFGTGMDTKAAKGTLWGAYNAVVECEDYRKGRNEDQMGASALFGERAQSKKRAFEYAVAQVR